MKKNIPPKKSSLLQQSIFCLGACIALGGFFTGCATDGEADDSEEATYIDTPEMGFGATERTAYLIPVPGRVGLYMEPGNREGLIRSTKPPESLVGSPYTGEVYRIPPSSEMTGG